MMASAFAQGYPNKPVRIIVPFTAGSGADIVARKLSEKLTEFWGQAVVVENFVGAGGTVGSAEVAKSPPDGYTLLVNTSAHAVNVAAYNKLPYDPVRDFIDVAPLVSQPFVLVVGASAEVKTVSDLIAAAKATPGKLKVGSAGTGSGTHMAAEKFRLAAGIDVVHLPNKGGPEANADAIAGRVTYWFSPIALALQPVADGKLVALGVTSARRSVLLPNVPTIAETGLTGFEDTIWYGLWTPSATPTDAVNRLSTDVARALATPEVRDHFAKMGTEPMQMTRTEFARFVRSEIDGAVRVFKAVGIQPQ
jgi:tripartite-type tricarboxylate transporter receptor subunit TctC